MANSSRASDCHSLQEVVYRANQEVKRHGVGEPYSRSLAQHNDQEKASSLVWLPMQAPHRKHIWKTWLAAGADWDDVLQDMYRVGRRDSAMRTKSRVTRPLMRRRRVGNAPMTMTMKKAPPDIEGTGAGVGSLSIKEERPTCSLRDGQDFVRCGYARQVPQPSFLF